MKSTIPSAPEGLSKRAAHLWRELNKQFCFDVGQLELLESALRSLDRAEAARAEVERDGIVGADRFGQPRTNPAVQVERDARSAFEQGMRRLDLHLPVGEG